MHKRRMVMWMLPAAAFTAVVFAGNPSLVPSDLPAAPQTSRLDLTIVHLMGRNHSITVKSTPHGPRYSAQSTDGALLASDLTLEELRVREPALFREVNQNLVDARDTVGPIGSIDAGD